MQNKNEFLIKFDEVNNVFGITGNTLRLLAQSRGIEPETLIIQVLTQWTKNEIPGLNLDEPDLTDEQKLTLLTKNIQPTTEASLKEAFIRLTKEAGESNEKFNAPSDGGHN